MSLFTPTALVGHEKVPPNVQALKLKLARMSRPLLLQSSKVSVRAEGRGQRPEGRAGQGNASHGNSQAEANKQDACL